MPNLVSPTDVKDADNCVNPLMSNSSSSLHETDPEASSVGAPLPVDSKAVYPQRSESTVLQMAALDNLYTAILDAVGGRIDKEGEKRLAYSARNDAHRGPLVRRTRELAAAFHQTMPNHWTAGFMTRLNGFVSRAASGRLRENEDYDLVFNEIQFR